MTSDWTQLPCELLARISTRIANAVPGVNRVVLDVAGKPPGHHRVGVGAPQRRSTRSACGPRSL